MSLLSAIKTKNDVQRAKQSKTIRPLAVTQARMNKTGLTTIRPLSAITMKKETIPITTTSRTKQYTLLTFLQFTKSKLIVQSFIPTLVYLPIHHSVKQYCVFANLT